MLLSNSNAHIKAAPKMALRKFPSRRGRKKKFFDQIERRSSRDFQIDEMNQVALLPSYGKEYLEEHSFRVPYPKEIVDYLDKFVVGQELAKRTLAVGIYQHYKRLENNTEVKSREFIKNAIESSINTDKKKSTEETEEYDEFYGSDPPLPKRKTIFERLKEEVPLTMEKSNIILLGPSGSGKTYLTQCLARLLDVPIAMCDCTTLTQAGYVGEDVETVIQKLLLNAQGNVERAQHGIVFLDEFDKIHSSSDPIHSVGNRDVEVDTTNILFIASGAFSNLEQIVARRIDKRVLGFGATNTNVAEDLSSTDETVAAERRNDLLTQTEQTDLMKFGMVPELVGRFPILVPFHALDEKMLIRVLQEPGNNLISQAKQLFAMDQIQLRFTRGAVNEMARIAVQRKTGARALRSIMEKVLLPAKYECPGTATHTVVITGAVVRGESSYVTMSGPKKKGENDGDTSTEK
ncbi:putative ATP-dependent Clp protease, ATP-binding subunit ClpX [Ancylostoma caninum]|uniref:Putative ATP-dependent Clp protease, ATP-binding subunit ClpX n=1 Tax=Ancylostoma caninum TaxID=29170 RepID=A0A368FS73_ANCCA|nr:putative ATP-dependent Clp protease, ATP-binding subunit ClpX [Ancylostoma caninum]